MKSYLISSDPGIDDLIGLMLLAKLSGSLSHCLISSFGNGPIEVTGVNAKEFISFIAPTWSYFQGSQKPLNGLLEHPWPDYFHGKDGVWGVHPNINTKNIKIEQNYPDYQQLISLCPLTEANKILRMGKLQSATVMGGAFKIAGNETPFAETNIAFDPDAAAHFFATDAVTEVRVVPLDVTRKVKWSHKAVLSIPEDTESSIWIKKVLLKWFDKYNHEREKDFNLHDPLAVYLTFFPDHASWVKSGVKVETKGEKRGQTKLNLHAPSCEVALGLDQPQAIAQEIFDILFGGSYS